MANKCQWIGADALRVGACCSNTVMGRNYCEDHLWLVYDKGTALRKRHKDIRTANKVFDLENTINEIIEELEDEGVL